MATGSQSSQKIKIEKSYQDALSKISFSMQSSVRLSNNLRKRNIRFKFLLFSKIFSYATNFLKI